MVGIDFGKPLFTSEEIQRKIQELGTRISTDYAEKDLLIIGVLKGALFFMADLLRNLRISVQMDFIHSTSSASRSEGGSPVKILSDIKTDIAGKDVLLIEDIMDSGVTIDALKKMLLERKPASLKVCVLLDKPDRRKVQIEADYAGFRIPNKYVVGYGLDYEDRYRNLPYIAVLPVEDR
ncbi:MAG: hypoxanthine phosphoribosyltransferase [Nitrospirae bacterium GWC2_57_13]|jgi:hypoxanthine phosphoribosyltransferase|nr:MAG: hypoxanthine phosphoribosyltransferase [Nitrospirae bacterium GWC1_57_7]OGW28911.1 MAG: hypoxanthine phosphoribosyltransferase [Nitrospirae bacterium GWC2_57_13]OGW43497.1 MAG: hypoxanthine phosphoribosyltransferase [Nitrospirae bacterium GWD2_57_8]HAR44703.1 hypoxanthine phosphoribosyltransferase [Nitrospiraceae bacterium]HAS53395.1 hypoxanthine phosphoribosyltransferase [Nitrospiraceae bacterium]